MSIGEQVQSGIVTMLTIAIVVSAVGGWALIEGLIWLYNNVNITVNN